MSHPLGKDETDRIRSLWVAWQSGRPTHQALYFDFHEQVIQQDKDLCHIDLFQTLGALVNVRATNAPDPD